MNVYLISVFDNGSLTFLCVIIKIYFVIGLRASVRIHQVALRVFFSEASSHPTTIGGGGTRVVVSTAAFYARVRVSAPGIGG